MIELPTPLTIVSREPDLNRARWPAGPWDDEPDFVFWKDGATGRHCAVVRNHGGALCGYAAVYQRHPWCGQDYNRSFEGRKHEEPSPYSETRSVVHGGLTFSGMSPSSHIPPSLAWWFGFDCGHTTIDISPNLLAMMPSMVFPSARYRTIDYVIEGCERLARVLTEKAVGSREEDPHRVIVTH